MENQQHRTDFRRYMPVFNWFYKCQNSKQVRSLKDSWSTFMFLIARIYASWSFLDMWCVLSAPSHSCNYIFLSKHFKPYSQCISNQILDPVIFVPDIEPFAWYCLSHGSVGELVFWVEYIEKELKLLNASWRGTCWGCLSKSIEERLDAEEDMGISSCCVWILGGCSCFAVLLPDILDVGLWVAWLAILVYK